jgi:AcrR family transcriptional regulator
MRSRGCTDVSADADGLRADARRNRDALVAAARQAFIDVGPDVALDVVARGAGVGVATLYRRFPDRDALVRAVIVESLGEVLDEIRSARRDEPTAWQALVRSVGYSPALKLLFHVATWSSEVTRRTVDTVPSLAPMRAEAIEMLGGLVRDAQREGALRQDVRVNDVVHLMAALAHAHTADDPGADTAFLRARAIVLDGLRHHDTSLPTHGGAT